MLRRKAKADSAAPSPIHIRVQWLVARPSMVGRAVSFAAIFAQRRLPSYATLPVAFASLAEPSMARSALGPSGAVVAARSSGAPRTLIVPNIASKQDALIRSRNRNVLCSFLNSLGFSTCPGRGAELCYFLIIAKRL